MSRAHANWSSASIRRPRSLRWKAGAVSDHWDWRQALDPQKKVVSISSFAEDQDGEMYLISLDGKIWKLTKS